MRKIFLCLTAIFLLFNAGTHGEPDYVTNLKKYFDDRYYTGTFYKKINSKDELETAAKEAFREYLSDTKHSDIERFFNEWKMTFQSDGPFETEDDLRKLTQSITEPQDFMTLLYIQDMLTNRDDYKDATEAYKRAFISKDNERVALFYLGDDDIMHGVLAAGVRSSMDATFIIYLTD